MNSILECFIAPGWDPMIHPAKSTREWMDNTPEKFAYRCLPLVIANCHGWEILSPCSFDVQWNGRLDVDAIQISGLKEQHVGGPCAVFGQGVLTFHVAGIFRTSPGWNLYITGYPNMPKDGVFPLTAVVETDWSPFTFTINHKITRPNTIIHYEKDEPICFVFPVQRNNLEQIEPKIRPLSDDPDLDNQFVMWQQSRNAFQANIKIEPKTGSDSWQKTYYRGKNMHDLTPTQDHKTKLHLNPFNK